MGIRPGRCPLRRANKRRGLLTERGRRRQERERRERQGETSLAAVSGAGRRSRGRASPYGTICSATCAARLWLSCQLGALAVELVWRRSRGEAICMDRSPPPLVFFAERITSRANRPPRTNVPPSTTTLQHFRPHLPPFLPGEAPPAQTLPTMVAQFLRHSSPPSSIEGVKHYLKLRLKVRRRPALETQPPCRRQPYDIGRTVARVRRTMGCSGSRTCWTKCVV